MDRQRRVVHKPLRYQTTSSDEGPTRKRSTAPATIVPGMIDNDIDDIARTLQQDENTTSYNIETHMTHTDIQNIQSYTNMHTHTNILPFTDHATPAQTHTNTFTHTSPIVFHEERQNTQNFTLGTECGKIFYTNENLSQSDVTGTTYIEQDQRKMYQQRGQNRGHAAYRPEDIPLHNIDKRTKGERIFTMEAEMKKMREQLNTVEADMKKMNGILQKILACVQDRHTTPQKPALLPITSLQQMEEFENLSEEDYSNAVNYFHYIGGFNLKESVNLCIKEGLSDSLAKLFTWFGREEGRRPLYNTRLIQAIYDAICKNRHFERPLRSEFQKQMRESLRVAKERHRSRMRGPRNARETTLNQDLWNDDELEEDVEATNDE